MSPRPDYSKGYVWGVYSSFQLFLAKDSGEIVKGLTTGPGYNAEATLSQDGEKVVFTSSRDGGPRHLFDEDGWHRPEALDE